MNEQVKVRLQNLGLNHLLNETNDLLKILLRALLNDKSTSLASRLEILVLIEEFSQLLITSEDLLKLTKGAFQSLLKTPINENNAALQGQALISITTVLLEVFQRDEETTKVGNISSHLVSHTEALLAMVLCQSSCTAIHLRSIAAHCLMEIELCLPGVLHGCLEAVYTATIFETSTAHQAYLELLTVLMCHSQENFSFAADTPRIKVPSTWSDSSNLSATELEQMVAFALSQLSLLTTSACVHVAGRMAALLQALSDSPQTLSLASVYMLQPVIQQYLSSHCLSACQLVLSLEKQFGSSEHFKDDAYRQTILEHLFQCSIHPGLPVASRLVFLEWLEDFLSRHADRTARLSEQQLIPTCHDGTHTRLKKIKLLVQIHKNKNASPTTLLKHLDSMQQQIKLGTASIKVKSAFIKVLFIICKDVDIDSDDGQKIQKLLVDTTVENITFAPFLFNLIQERENTQLLTDTLCVLMPAVLSLRKQMSLSEFDCLLEVMMQAVATQDINVSRPKEMLAYVSECLEKFQVDLNAATGHQVLSLCHKIMKLFDAREFLQEMEKILKTLPSISSEEDVQNRAHSYMALLACLSDTRVKAVLKAQKKSLAQLMVTDGMFHKPEAVVALDHPLVVLHKQKSRSHLRLPADDAKLDIEMTEAVVSLYHEYISSFAGLQCIEIPCSVTLTTLVSEDMPVVEALAIFLTPQNPFGTLEPLLVGNISRKLACSGTTEISTHIKYSPTKPYPVLLHARSEFSVKGVFHTAPMEPLKIDFIDLFQPLPVPDEYSDIPKHWRRTMFSNMWTTMQQKDSRHCLATSVIHCSVALVRSKIKHDLKPFVVQKGAHDADIAVFLAPANHMLIKSTFTDSSTIFKIATDNIFLLGHINDYLSQW